MNIRRKCGKLAQGEATPPRIVCSDSGQRLQKCQSGEDYEANLPPSIAMDAPVIYGALSEATNNMVCAISSGVAVRLAGTVATKPAFAATSPPVNRLNISVSTGPGATALTRTPKAIASSAADFVRPSTACLLAT